MKGKRFEDLATSYLKKKGYKILKRNFKCRFGEIDIIAFKKGVLVVVEVKGGKGQPRYRVDERKLRKIELTVNCFLKFTNVSYREIRTDVIEVTDGGIVHIKGVSL